MRKFLELWYMATVHWNIWQLFILLSLRYWSRVRLPHLASGWTPRCPFCGTCLDPERPFITLIFSYEDTWGGTLLHPPLCSATIFFPHVITCEERSELAIYFGTYLAPFLKHHLRVWLCVCVCVYEYESVVNQISIGNSRFIQLFILCIFFTWRVLTNHQSRRVDCNIYIYCQKV